MPNDITKLPKWAQSHIADMERKLARLEAHKAELVKQRNNTGPPDTDTFVDHLEPHDSLQRYQLLLRGAQVVWWPGEGFPDYQLGLLTARWDARDKALRITSSSRGRLVVSPVAGNVIHVREIDR